MNRPRGSLAARIAMLSVVVAVVTAVLAGVIGAQLITRSGESSARATLSRLANTAQSTVNDEPALGRARALRTLLAIRVQIGTVNRQGVLTAGNKLVQGALSNGQRQQLVAGHSYSLKETVNGVGVYVEARPTDRGGVILLQRHTDAVAVGASAIRRLFLALLVAVGVAMLLGLVVAWRLARPLKHTADAAHLLAAGHRDVTVVPSGPREVAEVAEAVNMLSSALSQSEGRQREFLLSVSHDLRTPLTSITGYAESLAEGVVPPEQTSEVGTVLLSEAHRLERLVRDLLDLARLDAQDFRVDLVATDLRTLVGDAARVWSDRCSQAGVVFRLEAPDTPLWTYTDPSRLRQVLDGLFDNALRVTPAGAPIVLAARLETVPGGGWIVVAEVRDGGPGLTDDDVAVAFNRSVLYDRYRGVRQVGTGLGLAIVHRLTARLGGTVEAGHAPEGGARFTVRLPAGAVGGVPS
jgi:two-component system, OmpR family, sensor kinase